MLKKHKVTASTSRQGQFFSLFVDFKEHQVKHLGQLGSREKIGEFLVDQIPKRLEILQSLHGGRKFAHLKMILVDFLANVGIFCLREEGIKHDAKKISVLIQISIDLLFISATLDLDKKIALDVLNERIQRHTANFPPKKIYVLDLLDVKKFADFMIFNFLDKFELYMKAFSCKKVANFSFRQIGQFKTFPHQLRIEEGDFLGEGVQVSNQISTLPDESTDGYIILRDPLKEEENKLENRGPIPSPYCYVLASIFMEQKEEESDKFTMEELDQLLGDGVTKNGFDIGQRPIYPDSKDLEQRWKNLSVQKREAIIREKLEKERQLNISKVMEQKLSQLKQTVSAELQEIENEYELNNPD